VVGLGAIVGSVLTHQRISKERKSETTNKTHVVVHNKSEKTKDKITQEQTIELDIDNNKVRQPTSNTFENGRKNSTINKFIGKMGQIEAGGGWVSEIISSVSVPLKEIGGGVIKKLMEAKKNNTNNDDKIEKALLIENKQINLEKNIKKISIELISSSLDNNSNNVNILGESKEGTKVVELDNILNE
jgi:hypothetical protein